MELGFVGLGNMGAPMARNLMKAGHHLTVFNRTREKAQDLQREGACVAQTAAEAAAAGLVFTMLADDAAVEHVVFGAGGILKALPRGGVHISLSTISPRLSRSLADAHRNVGQHYAAAPVFGRPESAAGAKLTVIAAGDQEAVERAKPLLDVIGQKTFVIGPEAPKANIIKINGNFLLATMVETFGEIYALLRKCGIDPKQFLEIVNGSVFKSPVFESYGNLIADQKFEPAGFKLKLGLKDVKLALAAADDATAPLPVASLLRDRFLSAVARGNGEKDWSAITAEAAAQAGL